MGYKAARKLDQRGSLIVGAFDNPGTVVVEHGWSSEKGAVVTVRSHAIDTDVVDPELCLSVLWLERLRKGDV